MALETMSERIARLEKESTSLDSPKIPGKWDSFKRKLYWGLGIATVAGTILGGVLTHDFLTKRQDFPVRNVLYKTTHTTYIAGNKEKKAADKADQEIIVKVNEGGGVESKVGTYICETSRERRGDAQYFGVENSQRRRIAMATQKPEKFQAGWSFRGTMNYKEEKAELLLADDAAPVKTKSSLKYMVYKLDPERGWRQNDIDVMEFPFEHGLRENEPGIIENDPSAPGKKDIRVMVNHLVETRNALGWFFGKHFRTQTLLEDFASTPENRELSLQFFQKVRALSSLESFDREKREEIVDKILKIERKMDKHNVYVADEDGYLKILPLGSTVYLGEDPNLGIRFLNWLGLNREEHNRLRINTHWNLFPGNWPGLNRVSIGKGENKNFPFDKYNNGGYTLRDKYGKIAMIDIEDFWLSYGQDALYDYYLDLNGDGRLDKKTELIGRVLCRFSHDEKAELDNIARGILPESDLTLNTNYYFMGPDADSARGLDYFKLCMYVETMMVNQVHRGQGQHSLLGIINDQRSDIMLFKQLNVENLSRSLTQESTLVAKHDIIRVLNAAKRPYAEKLAGKYGIKGEQEFAGQFQKTPLTYESPEVGNWLTLGAGLAGLGYLYNRRRMRGK